jgi:hypothetical protein
VSIDHIGRADAECIVVVDDDVAVVVDDDAGGISVVVGGCNYGYFHCAAGSSLAVASLEATDCAIAATRYMKMGVG